jgi:undecaprenyl-diphosphatase
VALADGWSFPSGHSSAAAVAYSVLAYLIRTAARARHRPALLPAATIAFVTAIGIGSEASRASACTRSHPRD